MALEFGFVGGAAADSFVVFVATTTINNSLRDPSDGGALALDDSQQVGGEILTWIVATGTQATTTSMTQLRALGSVGPSIGQVQGQTVKAGANFKVANRERVVFKLYNFCNIYRVGGQATCVAAQQATSTSRGLNLKAWIYSHN